MITVGGASFRRIVLFDFEFAAPPGHRPTPVCLVARELPSGRTIRLWRDELRDAPPYPIDRETLFVAYYASAEVGCHLALGWPVPIFLLDLYAEFRNLLNGLEAPAGAGLIGALAYFGLNALPVVEKKAMQELAASGGPYTKDQEKALVNYCESDVDALEALLPHLTRNINLGEALVRGRYMVAAAAVEREGTPVDVDGLARLRDGWISVKTDLIEEVDRDYGAYEGGSFRAKRFEAYLIQKGIEWPRHESGTLELSDDVFREMSRIYPQLQPLRELRHALSQLRLEQLAIGPDGRNRVLLSAFRSRTGRNQPSNSQNIFGPSTWIRSLLKPPPGYALAHIDYEQQEFGIAAALSGDQNMMHAYESGDPYWQLARLAGAVAPDALPYKDDPIRGLYKSTTLAVNYAMEERSLAIRLNVPLPYARELLRHHRRVFSRYWEWSDAAVDHALLKGYLHTRFGWVVRVPDYPNPRSLRNFLMQANGAEILRLAMCISTERRIAVGAAIHDALVIIARTEDIDAEVVRAQQAMGEASRLLLGNLTLRTEARIVRYPGRYVDKRGIEMWTLVQRLLTERAVGAPVHPSRAWVHTRSI